MPKLLVIYDPEDRVNGFPPDVRRRMNVQEATLSVPEGLDGKDIYTLARELAELLLKQL